MHDDIPASHDPFWRHSKVIRIPRHQRIPNGESTPTGQKPRNTALIEPIVCRANDDASRHHWRSHIAESGVKAPKTPGASATFADSTGVHEGMPLNPTGITVCGLQGGTVLGKDYAKELKHPDWCSVCQKKLESWLTAKEFRT